MSANNPKFLNQKPSKPLRRNRVLATLAIPVHLLSSTAEWLCFSTQVWEVSVICMGNTTYQVSRSCTRYELDAPPKRYSTPVLVYSWDSEWVDERPRVSVVRVTCFRGFLSFLSHLVNWWQNTAWVYFARHQCHSHEAMKFVFSTAMVILVALGRRVNCFSPNRLVGRTRTVALRAKGMWVWNRGQ